MEKTRKTGRPSSYREEYGDQARKLCRLGATDKDIAKFIGVSEKTLNTWKGVHSEFLQALKDGKDFADAEVADRLYKRATGYTHQAVKIFNQNGVPLIVKYDEHYPPDTVACIFWLKNRRPDFWRANPDGSASDNDHIQGFESVKYDE